MGRAGVGNNKNNNNENNGTGTDMTGRTVRGGSVERLDRLDSMARTLVLVTRVLIGLLAVLVLVTKLAGR